jgi:hypothetical protein
MSHETPVQPPLADLLARYLERQAEAHALGTAAEAGEVTPYEAGPVQPIDARLAWQEALAALVCHGATEATTWPALPHWPALVAAHEPVMALPLAAGNFPQLVRDFQPLLHRDATAPSFEPGTAIAVPQLLPWAENAAAQRQVPQMLLALGGLRLAKQFAAAEDYIRRHDSQIPSSWRQAWGNEQAAFAWHAGKLEDARTRWQALEPSVPVQFNRGVAALFLGDAAAARSSLEAAATRLPENAWQHLARLYLALADLRGA